MLDAACQAIADGSGAIVSITGESGIGKSRLVVEARRRFGDRIRFLEGRAGSYAESFPYWPVRDLLRDWLSIGVDAPEARVRLELKAALGGLGDGAETAYPFLARLLGLPLEAEAERGAARAQPRGRAAADVRRGRRGRARGSPTSGPLCIVVDDLQWADSLTLELVEDLLALTDEVQLGVVLIYRADRDQPSWRLGEHARARTSRTATARSSCARCRPARAASWPRRSPRRRCPPRSPTCSPSARAATRSSSRRRCRT